MKTYFLNIFIIISLLSCNSNNATKLNYMYDVIHIKGEPIQMEQLIGNPYSIMCVDSLLVYCDFYDGKHLSFFDLKNNRFVGRFLSYGQGPNDALHRVSLITYPQKDQLYIYQDGPAKISILDLLDFQMQTNLQIVSSTPWRPFEVQRTKDYYIGLGIFDEGSHGVFSIEGALLYTGGTYPFKGKDMESRDAFLIYQGKFCTNPDKNYFASGCVYSDHISFYEVKENEIILLKEYYSYDANVEYSNKGGVKPNDKTTINYSWAFGTASYCYMLFNGKAYADNNGKTNEGRYIIIFDWHGNYKKTYYSDYEIRSFCVDETNNYIYATARDDDGDFIIIKLKI